MSNYYSINPRFYISVDCIIFGFNEGELNLLLLKRNFQPAMGEWSLMGGFVQQGESVDNAAKRVLAELTGLENVYMEQVGSFGEVERDPGERVISVAYYALININEYDRELVHQHNAYWVNINELPPLIFDHPQMVKQARELMQQKASTEPIGFNLLPKLFTLSQLQSLYEAIYGEQIDKRNFRKRIAEMDYIEKTDKIYVAGHRGLVGSAIVRNLEAKGYKNIIGRCVICLPYVLSMIASTVSLMGMTGWKDLMMFIPHIFIIGAAVTIAVKQLPKRDRNS